MTALRQVILLLVCLTALAVTAAVTVPHVSLAQEIKPDVPLTDPALEARARKLMKDVRCVVCQAQSIDESDAGIASDMRRLIRSEIAAGKSDDDIRQYLASRYGDFVLFKPPFKATTALLWAGPFLLLLLGATIIVVFFRRRAAVPAQAGLSPDEARRVADALRETPDDGTRQNHGSGR